jgi:hypothetical protein
MFLEMERTVARLREDLKSFQGNSNSSPRVLESMAHPTLLQQEKFAGTGAELPSFFSNNPWLDVLSRRGREESAPIAG